MELEATIHGLLARRTQRRVDEFRRDAIRWKQRDQGSVRDVARHRRIFDPVVALDDAKAITSQRGFLCEQLQLPGLTPLKRLHVQLQLVEMDDREARSPSPPALDDGATGGNPQSALERSLAVILCDRSCFDVSYVASPTRVDDVKETLFDPSEFVQHVCEALAFSSTHHGKTARVVFYRMDDSTDAPIRARSSLNTPLLEKRLNNFVRGDDDPCADSIVDLLWR